MSAVCRGTAGSGPTCQVGDWRGTWVSGARGALDVPFHPVLGKEWGRQCGPGPTPRRSLQVWGVHRTEWPQPGLLRAARPTLLRFSIPEPSPCSVSSERVLIVSAPSRNSTASFSSPAVHPPQPFPSSVCERTFHLDEGPGAGRWAPWGPTRPDLPGPWAHAPGCLSSCPITGRVGVHPQPACPVGQ